MAPTTVTVKSVAATLQSNTLGRKFQDPTRADSPVFVKHFSYTNATGGTLADGSVIDFGPILGPCIIMAQSHVNSTALGASRILNLGLQEYQKQKDGTTVAANLTTLITGLDVSAAVKKELLDTTSDTVTGGLNGVEVYGIVNLLGQVTGGTIPNGAVISGTILMAKVL